MRRSPKIAPNRDAVHPFDLKYGTDTGGYLSPEHLHTGEVSDSTNNGYSAVAPSVFHEACCRWQETLPVLRTRVEAYTFVDIGAGKGRVLLLATQYPFRNVIGVEVNSELARTAEKNVERWSRTKRSPSRIRVVQQDAAEFRWPRHPLLVFLNNPFDCSVIERLAARLAAAARSGTGLIDILYVNPGCVDTFTANPNFKLLWNAQIQMNGEDQQADPYGAATDRVSALRYFSA